MKTKAVSGGSMPHKAPMGKAGCENPTPGARHVDVGIPHKHTMPVAAMAGSFSRKIPGPVKAGQDVAGHTKHGVAIKHAHKKLTKSMGGKGAGY